MIRFKFLLRTSLILLTEIIFTDLEGSLIYIHHISFHSSKYHRFNRNPFKLFFAKIELPLLLKALSQVCNNFWQLKALYKWSKILFISPQKLFSFSRYLNFCLDFLVMYQNGLIRKIKLMSNWREGLVNKQSQYTYCPISREVEAINRI